MDRVLLDGYVSERSKRKRVNGEEVEIVTYQGEHCDEYLVREMENGRCSLFYKGIIQMNWKEVDGIRAGEFTLYEIGKALKIVCFKRNPFILYTPPPSSAVPQGPCLTGSSTCRRDPSQNTDAL